MKSKFDKIYNEVVESTEFIVEDKKMKDKIRSIRKKIMVNRKELLEKLAK